MPPLVWYSLRNAQNPWVASGTVDCEPAITGNESEMDRLEGPGPHVPEEGKILHPAAVVGRAEQHVLDQRARDLNRHGQTAV